MTHGEDRFERLLGGGDEKIPNVEAIATEKMGIDLFKKPLE